MDLLHYQGMPSEEEAYNFFVGSMEDTPEEQPAEGTPEVSVTQQLYFKFQSILIKVRTHPELYKPSPSPVMLAYSFP